jgi:hypothetical protein
MLRQPKKLARPISELLLVSLLEPPGLIDGLEIYLVMFPPQPDNFL